jgi:hypothetical protein
MGNALASAKLCGPQSVMSTAFALHSLPAQRHDAQCQLRRRGMRWPVEVGLAGRPPVEARMWPSAFIKTQIGADRRSSLGHRIVCSEIDLLAFDPSPKPLDKSIVTPRTLAVQ